MLTETEFDAILELVLEELSGIVLRDGEAAVSTNVPLRVEIDQAVSAFRDPSLRREGVLATSFGLVDEFVRARRDEIVHELYSEYVQRKERG